MGTLTKDTQMLIAIIGEDFAEYTPLITLLEENHYKSLICESIQQLKEVLSKKKCMAILIDIDSVPVGNRQIRQLTLAHPDSPFLCMSSDRYHPELKEAICYHIYACINKPIDYDELFYLLGSIRDDNE
ncbi:hypothetical protein [Desulfobacula sp.]